MVFIIKTMKKYLQNILNCYIEYGQDNFSNIIHFVSTFCPNSVN